MYGRQFEARGPSLEALIEEWGQGVLRMKGQCRKRTRQALCQSVRQRIDQRDIQGRGGYGKGE